MTEPRTTPGWRAGVTPGVVVAFVAWAALVVLAYEVGRRSGQPVNLCMFRKVTGVPCATCGATRATAHLLALDVRGALALNPLMTVLALMLPAWVLWRVTLGRGRSLAPGTRRRVVWALLGALLVNWGYVLWHERGSWEKPTTGLRPLPGFGGGEDATPYGEDGAGRTE